MTPFTRCAYRDRANDLDRWAASRAAAEAAIDTAYNSPHLVAAHLTAGMSLDQAQAAAARETALPLETIARHWRKYLRDRDTTRRQHRNMLIMRMAGRGLSNADIAAKTGLHPNSISRIIGRALRPTTAAE